MKWAFLLLSLGLIFCICGSPAQAEQEVVRIGVLTDLSGSMADAAGRGSVEAAEMAVEDAGHFTNRQIALITADYQNRRDLAEHISEDWIKRQNVDAVVDVPNAAIAADLQELFHDQGKILLSSNPRRPDDANCGMNGLFWLYDRETLNANLIRALLADHKRWFILGGDSVYSMNLASSTKALIQKNGGEIAGEAYLGPRLGGLGAILDQIKNSKADVAYLAFERPEILHLLRHWPELAGKDAPPLAFGGFHFSDMYDLKDYTLPRFYIVTSFYWNQDGGARAFSDRFAERNHGAMPTAIQASVYSAVYHYLQSVAAMRAKTAEAILAHMKSRPLQDGPFSGSRIRSDGVLLHHVHLLLSKNPQEREGPSDFFRVVRNLSVPELILPPEIPCPAIP